MISGEFEGPVAAATATATASRPAPPRLSRYPRHVNGGFLFFYFYFRFLQKYIFDLEIYRNIPRPPRCRAAGTWPPGSGAAGAFLKKISRRKLRAGPWGPVARQRGGRPPRPPGSGATSSHKLYIRVDWSPHLSFASLKFQKKKEKRGREGERRSPAKFLSRRLQVTKILLRFTNSLCCNYFC